MFLTLLDGERKDGCIIVCLHITKFGCTLGTTEDAISRSRFILSLSLFLNAHEKLLNGSSLIGMGVGL